MMDYAQVIVGLVAGMVYSILGYLKNTSGKDIIELDPKEVAEKILTERSELGKLEEAISIVSLIFWSKLYGEKLYFNWSEFSKTLIHGLAIGFLIGFLDIPLDSAVSLVSQLGLLTTTRKIAAIIRNTSIKIVRLSRR
ncbi:MAG: hypothetical protein LZ168_04445 [Thaumarchaeota archaeon]|jgi:hypothetical protein|nr:hypothetical protein [Candidatus Geocrenenecus arthurdayi]